MITFVDAAMAAVVAMLIGVLVGGINRAGHETNNPESEQQSAAAEPGNAGPLWVFVPNRECERVTVAPCIRKHARYYAKTFRN